MKIPTIQALSLMLLLAIPLQSQARMSKAISLPLHHPIATMVVGAAGYATIKAYCDAGAPAVAVDDGTGKPVMAKIDCSGLGATIEHGLGDVAESLQNKPGFFARAKHLIERSATAELRKSLNAERVATGEPPDPDDCEAHHIVPKKEARPWAANAANRARDAIGGCVDIDDADNGVYLPGKKVGPFGCVGSYHKTLHTAEYYEFIANKLFSARDTGGCSKVRSELRIIKRLLESGEL